jgi:ribosomal protein L30/L7E
MRNAFNILGRKCERKSPLGRHNHRWEDNIRLYLREIGLERVDWINLAQDRNQWWGLLNTVINLLFP